MAATMQASPFDHRAWAASSNKPVHLSNGLSSTLASGVEIDGVSDHFSDAFAQYGAQRADNDSFDVSLFLDDSFLDQEASPMLSNGDSSIDSPASQPQAGPLHSYGLFDDEPEMLKDWSLDSVQVLGTEDPFFELPSSPSYQIADSYTNYEFFEPSNPPAIDPQLQCSPEQKLDSVKSWVETRSGPPEAPAKPASAPSRPSSGARKASTSTTDSSSASPASASPASVAAPKRRKRKALSAAEAAAKRERFLERNRLAAKKCREKKKGSTSGLQDQMKGLERERFDIISTLETLHAEVEALKQQLGQHQGCGVEMGDALARAEAKEKEESSEGIDAGMEMDMDMERQMDMELDMAMDLSLEL